MLYTYIQIIIIIMIIIARQTINTILYMHAIYGGPQHLRPHLRDRRPAAGLAQLLYIYISMNEWGISILYFSIIYFYYRSVIIMCVYIYIYIHIMFAEWENLREFSTRRAAGAATDGCRSACRLP